MDITDDEMLWGYCVSVGRWNKGIFSWFLGLGINFNYYVLLCTRLLVRVNLRFRSFGEVCVTCITLYYLWNFKDDVISFKSWINLFCVVIKTPEWHLLLHQCKYDINQILLTLSVRHICYYHLWYIYQAIIRWGADNCRKQTISKW